MTYEEAMELIREHTDYGGSLDQHALAIAFATITEAEPPDSIASAGGGVSDGQIDDVFMEWNSHCYGNPIESHRRFARSILALKTPQATIRAAAQPSRTEDN